MFFLFSSFRSPLLQNLDLKSKKNVVMARADFSEATGVENAPIRKAYK